MLLLITDKHRGLEQKERELRVGLTLTAQVTHFELCVVNQWIILDRLQELFLNWGKTEKNHFQTRFHRRLFLNVQNDYELQ